MKQLISTLIIIILIISIVAIGPCLTATGADEPETVYPTRGDDSKYYWRFFMPFLAPASSSLELVELIIIDYMGNNLLWDFVIKGKDLHNLFHTDRIEAGDILNFGDGHPVTNNFNYREYILKCIDENENEVIQTHKFLLLTEIMPEIETTLDTQRDLFTLRHNADFEVEVSEGIYWVPARALGESRYTNLEILTMLGRSPESKQESISTLYEALQLFQIGGVFTQNRERSHWKRDITENGNTWQFGISGYHAVRSNQGDCEGVSNWLNYILSNDYDEVGFIHYGDSDNSGHVWNYIKHNDWYYFIDMTQQTVNSYHNPVESGDRTDYLSGDAVLGKIHKTRSPEDFVQYLISVHSKYGNNHALVYMYTAENVAVCGWRSRDFNSGRLLAIIPGVEYSILYDNDSLPFSYVDHPASIPDWSDVPSRAGIAIINENTSKITIDVDLSNNLETDANLTGEPAINEITEYSGVADSLVSVIDKTQPSELDGGSNNVSVSTIIIISVIILISNAAVITVMVILWNKRKSMKHETV